ncbi:MAG TPA: hypothetical protein VF665_20900 [Longimicrobium sp.]|jgi:hypothetical protein|uniref:hypothetical protein n=1 Tax=Longimicrobium sp. TaxID=2029185 RepID=UPI002ED809C4
MGLRTFRDARNREWRVWDVQPDNTQDQRIRSLGHLPVDMAGGWLCFETEGEKRRLSPVPDGWDVDDVEALSRLCRLASRVVRGERRTVDAST